MDATQMVGAVVVALISIITLFSLISKPFSSLTEAINKLNILVEKLSTNLDNTEKLVQKMDTRLMRAEKKLQAIELNCAKSGHYDGQHAEQT